MLLKLLGFFEETEKQGNDWSFWIIMGVMLVVMIVMMVIPQRKQKKRAEEMMNRLAVGSTITTIGGIIGKIVSIKEETVTIETSHDRTKIRILRSAVRNVDVKAEDAQD